MVNWQVPMSDASHWDSVYARKGDDVSWYRPTLQRSLAIIDKLELPSHPAAIDVGAGASTLVDDLLGRGFSMTVADLSDTALAAVRERLGQRAAGVQFLVGDITELELPQSAFDLWHDRAVFHFLTAPGAREAYLRQVRKALRPGGHVIVATFAPEGPEQCSGLPVMRYDEQSLHATFGAQDFRKLGHEREAHRTPWGSEQEFVYCYCRCETC